MPAGVQKNVRLSEMGAETLRALKYDLDSSDGEVVALALERMAVERLRHHDAVVKRVRLGMLDQAEAVPSRAAIAALTAALNLRGECYAVDDQGRVRLVSEFGDYNEAAQRVVERAATSVVRDLGLTEVTVGALLVAACEAPGAERFAGLGVPVGPLARHLREALRGPADTSRPAEGAVAFTWAAKSLVMEGASGLAAVDGIGAVRPEHILVAALGTDDGDVLAACAAVGVDPAAVQELLRGGPPRPDEGDGAAPRE